MTIEFVKTLTDAPEDTPLMPLAYLLDEYGPITVTNGKMEAYEGRAIRFTKHDDETVTLSLVRDQ